MQSETVSMFRSLLDVVVFDVQRQTDLRMCCRANEAYPVMLFHPRRTGVLHIGISACDFIWKISRDPNDTGVRTRGVIDSGRSPGWATFAIPGWNAGPAVWDGVEALGRHQGITYPIG